MSARAHHSTSRVSGLAIVVIGLVIVLLVGTSLVAIHFARAGGDSDHASDIGAAQDMVKGKFGATAVFGPIAETSYEATADGQVKVSGSVHVVASSGTSSNYSYTVLMHRNPDGEWVADDISLIPI